MEHGLTTSVLSIERRPKRSGGSSNAREAPAPTSNRDTATFTWISEMIAQTTVMKLSHGDREHMRIPPEVAFEFQQALSELPGRSIDAYFALVPNGPRLLMLHTSKKSSKAARAQILVSTALSAGEDRMEKIIQAFLRDAEAGRIPAASTAPVVTALEAAGLQLRAGDIPLPPPASPTEGPPVIASPSTNPSPTGSPGSRRTVFLVQGRHHEVNEALTDYLMALDLRVLQWEEVVRATGKGNPYIGDVIVRGMQDADAIVVLFTAEDKVQLDVAIVPTAKPDELLPGHQPRPNVLIEAGMALAIDADRTLIVQFGDIRPATDLDGRHLLRIGGATVTWRHDLAARLESIGLHPRTTSGRHLTAGSFPAL